VHICIPQYDETMSYLKRLLLYVTNNEEISRHEQGFDVAFFIVNTVAIVVGSTLLIAYNEPHWIAFLVIEYVWALDNMRHNRP